MGKKILSLCMALALCLALLSVTALAADNDKPNNLYVGNHNVKSGDDTTYWATTDSGELELVEGASDTSTNWNVKYDPNSATLTLKNATIKGVSNNVNTVGTGIYAASSSGPVSLNIVLEGENKVSGGYGINVSSGGAASLSISGSGSLTVSATATNGIGIFVQAQSGNANLAINGANVNAVVTEDNGRGVELSTGQDGNPNLTIEVKGGSLQASGQPNGIIFFTNKNNTQAIANLKVSGNAMVKTSRITTEADGTGSQGAVLTTEAGTGETGGIVWDGKKGTVYGDVTLQENLTIGEGESLTIPEGSSLNANGKLTNDGTVTIENGGTLNGSDTINNTGTINVENGGNLGGTPTGTVVYAPTITKQPEAQSVTVGQTATFTVAATGENLSYQWQQKTTDSGSDWTNVGSATSSNTYTIDNTTTSMSGYQYRCVVSNSAGSVTSDAATLTVTALPEPEPEPEPTPPPYIPPTYAVTAPETTGGTVTVSPSRASSGRTVTITATPDLGYELESLTVLDSQGNEIALTDKGDGKYTFTMPASRVTVEASFTPAPLPFEDVAPGAWYESAVRYAYLHDIMEGMSETEFAPATALTRAMAVQIFYNLEGQPDISGENLGYPYEDVNAQAWYGDAVYWARLTGVATGYGDGTFQPTDSITRQEFAQMLYNYAKYKGCDLTAEGDLSQFPDSGSVADWAEAAMIWANGNELINGHDDGTIDAAGIGTRAQAASILMRFDQNLVKN